MTIADMKDLATIFGFVVAAISLVFAAYNTWLTYKINRARFGSICVLPSRNTTTFIRSSAQKETGQVIQGRAPRRIWRKLKSIWAFLSIVNPCSSKNLLMNPHLATYTNTASTTS